jgi:hypothetical protein
MLCETRWLPFFSINISALVLGFRVGASTCRTRLAYGKVVVLLSEKEIKMRTDDLRIIVAGKKEKNVFENFFKNKKNKKKIFRKIN